MIDGSRGNDQAHMLYWAMDVGKRWYVVQSDRLMHVIICVGESVDEYVGE